MTNDAGYVRIGLTVQAPGKIVVESQCNGPGCRGEITLDAVSD